MGKAVFRENTSFALNSKISKDSDPVKKIITHTSRNDYMKNCNYGPATKKRYLEEAMAHSKPGLLIWRLRQRWERYSYEKKTQ
jgi:hypothetical protein